MTTMNIDSIASSFVYDGKAAGIEALEIACKELSMRDRLKLSHAVERRVSELQAVKDRRDKELAEQKRTAKDCDLAELKNVADTKVNKGLSIIQRLNALASSFRERLVVALAAVLGFFILGVALLAFFSLTSTTIIIALLILILLMLLLR